MNTLRPASSFSKDRETHSSMWEQNQPSNHRHAQSIWKNFRKVSISSALRCGGNFGIITKWLLRFMALTTLNSPLQIAWLHLSSKPDLLDPTQVNSPAQERLKVTKNTVSLQLVRQISTLTLVSALYAWWTTHRRALNLFRRWALKESKWSNLTNFH